MLRFTTAGSVDDGKSTLIGRLLYETSCVYLDHVAEAQRSTSNASVAAAGEEIDFSLLCDGLKAEREQGITIDVAYRYFSTPDRKFIIADTPGHEQYTRNMATGASTANLAIVLIDARKGLLPQSKRHAFISALLGVKHTVVCVNKMDLVDYREEVFEEIVSAFQDFAARLEVPDLRFLPISALKGDNVVQPSSNMPWFRGRPLLELLETVHSGSDRNLIDFRFPVQLVVRPDQDFRGYAGQVASGVIRPGDEVLVLPSRQRSRVSRIVTYDGDQEAAFPPQSVTLCLEDQVDISRGDMLVAAGNQPHVARRLEGMVVWMASDPMREGQDLLVKHTTQTVRARVERIRYAMDVNTLSRVRQEALGLNEIGRVVLSTQQPLFHDAYARNRATGSLIFIDPETNGTVGAAMIIDRVPTDALQEEVEGWHEEDDLPVEEGSVTAAERATRLGHGAVTVWLTGLPSSGGAEVAMALERRLFDRDVLAHVLSGREVRATLSRDLDHSPRDVSEHLRRVSALARSLNRAGLVVVGSFVSPLRAVRAQARDMIGAERFVLVHVDPPVEWCAERDPRGVYARARAGELLNVAGVNAPYEPPESPDLVVRPDRDGFEEAAAQIEALLAERGFVPARDG
jgi:bifunctional enzyme CysN/CysC